MFSGGPLWPLSRWTGACLAAALPLAGPRPAFAQFKLPDKPEGLPGGELPALIAQIVQAGLLLVGVIALGFIVYGGFKYILSRGNESEVEAAKSTITYAVVGLLFIGAAYAIVSFVIGAFG